MTDPLADWYHHTLSVERWNGDSAYGDQYDAAESVTGFYDDKTVYNAGQVTATGRFAFPSSVAYIPVQSRITLPARFGGHVVHVVASSVGDGAGQPTPDHQEIEVL